MENKGYKFYDVKTDEEIEMDSIKHIIRDLSQTTLEKYGFDEVRTVSEFLYLDCKRERMPSGFFTDKKFDFIHVDKTLNREKYIRKLENLLKDQGIETKIKKL
jgi:hypothetical protein